MAMISRFACHTASNHSTIYAETATGNSPVLSQPSGTLIAVTSIADIDTARILTQQLNDLPSGTTFDIEGIPQTVSSALDTFFCTHQIVGPTDLVTWERLSLTAGYTFLERFGAQTETLRMAEEITAAQQVTLADRMTAHEEMDTVCIVSTDPDDWPSLDGEPMTTGDVLVVHRTSSMQLLDMINAPDAGVLVPTEADAIAEILAAGRQGKAARAYHSPACDEWVVEILDRMIPPYPETLFVVITVDDEDDYENNDHTSCLDALAVLAESSFGDTEEQRTIARLALAAVGAGALLALRDTAVNIAGDLAEEIVEQYEIMISGIRNATWGAAESPEQALLLTGMLAASEAWVTDCRPEQFTAWRAGRQVFESAVFVEHKPPEAALDINTLFDSLTPDDVINPSEEADSSSTSGHSENRAYIFDLADTGEAIALIEAALALGQGVAAATGDDSSTLAVVVHPHCEVAPAPQIDSDDIRDCDHVIGCRSALEVIRNAYREGHAAIAYPVPGQLPGLNHNEPWHIAILHRTLPNEPLPNEPEIIDSAESYATMRSTLTNLITDSPAPTTLHERLRASRSGDVGTRLYQEAREAQALLHGGFGVARYNLTTIDNVAAVQAVGYPHGESVADVIDALNSLEQDIADPTPWTGVKTQKEGALLTFVLACTYEFTQNVSPIHAEIWEQGCAALRSWAFRNMPTN